MTSPRKIGVYGGTFDPVHNGHLALAKACLQQCGLDEVWLVPAAHPPHKAGRAISPASVRVELLRLAIAGESQLKLSNVELTREGPSYTVDTLRELVRLNPGVAFTLLLGADAIADFPGWKQPEEILQLARIAAVNRGDEAPLVGLWPASLQRHVADRVTVVRMPPLVIAASEIRSRAALGLDISGLVPPPVAARMAKLGFPGDGRQVAGDGDRNS